MSMERTIAVDVIAWIFIALAGIGILAGASQWVLVPAVSAELLLPEHEAAAFHHLKAIILAKLAVMTALLAASLGVLRRRNFARLAFIAVALLSAAWSAADIVLRTWFDVSIPFLPGGLIYPQLSWSYCLLAAGAVWTLTRPPASGEFVD